MCGGGLLTVDGYRLSEVCSRGQCKIDNIDIRQIDCLYSCSVLLILLLGVSRQNGDGGMVDVGMVK